MIRIFDRLPVLSTGTTEFKIPIPAGVKGKVVAARMCSNEEIANSGAETIDLRRGTVSVNLITTAATYVAGTVVTGVPDAGSADLMFDGDSTTEANRAIDVACSQMAASGSVGLEIDFDDNAKPGYDLTGTRRNATS